VPWVGEEIRAAWPTYQPEELVRELISASQALPPSYAELARCVVPAGVVALADDPVHPAAVAMEWANALPTAELETVQMHEPATDVSVFGAAAVRAWLRAQTVSESR
jgi:pimeloyl-ACP methyl ester carboxylesterase